MRNLVAGLLLSLAACSEQVEETYPTWAEARGAGAVARGWIPAFVPSTAREIRDFHDLDSNRQTLLFIVEPSEVAVMIEELPPVSIENKGAVADLSSDHGFAPESEAYVMCSKPLNGALVVDRESGRVVYTTAVAWADDECSKSLSAPDP